MRLSIKISTNEGDEFETIEKVNDLSDKGKEDQFERALAANKENLKSI